jgi:hypothetical protein
MPRFSLRTLLMVSGFLACVVSFGIAMSLAYLFALDDALRERLDGPTLAATKRYFEDTWIPRAAGFAIIAGFWAIAGFAVGRLSSKT